MHLDFFQVVYEFSQVLLLSLGFVVVVVSGMQLLRLRSAIR